MTRIAVGTVPHGTDIFAERPAFTPETKSRITG